MWRMDARSDSLARAESPGLHASVSCGGDLVPIWSEKRPQQVAVALAFEQRLDNTFGLNGLPAETFRCTVHRRVAFHESSLIGRGSSVTTIAVD